MQRGLKQNQSVMLSMLVEGRLTNVGVARLFDESRKIVRRIDGTAFPRHEYNDLGMIHHPTMDCTYAKIHYPYFSQAGGPSSFA